MGVEINIHDGFYRPKPAPREASQQEDVSSQAMDRLTEANRVQIEGWNLPMTKLTDEQGAEVAKKFDAFLIEHEIPQSLAAKEMRFSASTVSQFRSGTYKGNPDKIARTANDWMERFSRRKQLARNKAIIPTRIIEDIEALVATADRMNKMAAIVGPSGSGKTLILKALAETYRGVYCVCPDNPTCLHLLRAIAVAIGLANVNLSRGELLRQIIESLTGTRRIIFLDEAHRTGKHVGVLRSIYDEAGVPIILCGTVEILQCVNDRSHGRGQFSSRTLQYNALDLASNAQSPDGGKRERDLYSIEEIKAFLQMRKIRIDRDALKMLWALSCLPDFGTLRTVESCVDLVLIQQPGIVTITRDDIRDALQSLIGAGAMPLEAMAERYSELNYGSESLAVARAG